VANHPTPCTLGLLPSGRLHCFPGDGEATSSNGAALLEALSRDPAEGLFTLAADKPGAGLDPVLRYWHDFATHYLSGRCRLEEGVEQTQPLPQLTEVEIDQWRQGAPPMPGLEYLSREGLQQIWCQLDAWVCEAIRSHGSLAALLRQRAPQWHSAGRVCFHLAENPRDPELPFAFMATYVPTEGPSGKGGQRYQPLHQALTEYAQAKDRQALIRLLSPVQRAAEASPLVADLLATGDLYHPLAWTAEEAYRFLREAALYEECGLVVRLPDWWRKRSRPQVAVRIGGAPQGGFNAAALLDFKLQVVIGEESLSEQELANLLRAQSGLIFLKGQWVEVNQERMQEALAHWRRVESEVGHDGLSFIQGMRLLAGSNAELDRDNGTEVVREWSRVEPSAQLAELLTQLRSPAAIAAVKLGRDLRATLRPYQEQGVRWLWLLSRLGLGACLADDMGLGKTLQVIALLLLFKRHTPKGEVRPSLLILPASLLANWAAELARFAPSLRYSVVHTSHTKGGQGGEDEAELVDCDLLLTTYHTLTRRAWLLQRRWRLLVLDEAQAIKNPATRQSKAVKQIEADARIALTGTPVENSLADLWSLFDFLNPGLLGSSSRFKTFAKGLAARTHDPYAPLRQLTQPYILRRLKSDRSIIADLPEKTEVAAWCGLSKVQAAHYQQAVKELKRGLETLDGIERRGLVLSYLLRFKQICNHPSQLVGDGRFEPAMSGKFLRLAELCEEIAARQEKVLVFTQFREIIEPLARFLAEQFGRPGLILHGGTPVAQRQQRVDAFQQEAGPPFFVLSLKAGGTGLTLTEASHVIHFDRWWNPAVENQATDRAFRIGQKRSVLVHKFICRGTIEEKIDALLCDKRHLADDLLREGGELPLTEMDDETLLGLVTLDINKSQLT